MCAVLLTAPLRGSAVRLPPDYGFGPWQTDNSGRQFREAEAVSSLFVDPAITSVEVPMRLRDDRPAGSALVAVTVPGFSRIETRIGSEWTMQLVPLPGAEALEPCQRINLAMTQLEGAAPLQGIAHVEIGQVRVVSRK